MSLQKKLFITGGSGYIGSVIIEYAIASYNYSVTALSRSPSSDAKLVALGATPVRGDMTSVSLLQTEASKADVVINLADARADALTNKEANMESLMAINAAAIAALATGLKGTGKPLILTGGSLQSATDPEGKITDENSPGWPEGHPFHKLSTFMGPNIAFAMEQGVRVCNCRLAPFVYGRGGSGVALFMRMFAANGSGFYIGDGNAKTSTVHVDDAARLYLLLAEKGKAGEEYNAISEIDVSQADLAKAICKAVGIGCASLEFDVAKANMGEFLATFLQVGCRADNSKARGLGWVIEAEKGILGDIETGSYVQVAEGLVKKE